MIPKAVAVAVLSSVAIAAGGCSGDSDAEAQSPVDIAQLRADLEERWGAPPHAVAPVWYRHITAIDWANGQLEITTDLSPEEYGANEGLRGTCGEPLKLAFEQVDYTVDLIAAVFSTDGVGLGGCG